MLSLVRPSLTVEIVVVDAPRFGTRMPPARPVRGNVICWAIRGQPLVGLRRFIFNDGIDQFLGRPLRTGPTSALGRKQHVILSFGQ